MIRGSLMAIPHSLFGFRGNGKGPRCASPAEASYARTSMPTRGHASAPRTCPRYEPGPLTGPRWDGSACAPGMDPGRSTTEATRAHADIPGRERRDAKRSTWSCSLGLFLHAHAPDHRESGHEGLQCQDDGDGRRGGAAKTLPRERVSRNSKQTCAPRERPRRRGSVHRRTRLQDTRTMARHMEPRSTDAPADAVRCRSDARAEARTARPAPEPSRAVPRAGRRHRGGERDHRGRGRRRRRTLPRRGGEHPPHRTPSLSTSTTLARGRGAVPAADEMEALGRTERREERLLAQVSGHSHVEGGPTRVRAPPHDLDLTAQGAQEPAAGARQASICRRR